MIFCMVNIVAVTVEIIMVTALLPIIAVTIINTQNLTATERTIQFLRETLRLSLTLSRNVIFGTRLGVRDNKEFGYA